MRLLELRIAKQLSQMVILILVLLLHWGLLHVIGVGELRRRMHVLLLVSLCLEYFVVGFVAGH
jgi:hypothetical protein